jgi:hypothetical protein
MKPHSLCHALLVEELIQISTSYVVEFSSYVPLYGEQAQPLTVYIALFVIMLQYADTLSHHILVLNGTKHQLSVYNKMPISYILLSRSEEHTSELQSPK